MSIIEVIEKLGPLFPYKIVDNTIECSYEEHQQLLEHYRICLNKPEKADEYLNELRYTKETIKVLKIMGNETEANEFKHEQNQKIYEKYIKALV